MKWLPVVLVVLSACGPVRTPWEIRLGMTHAEALEAANGPGCAEYAGGAFYRPHVRDMDFLDYVQTSDGEWRAACHVPEWTWAPGDTTYSVILRNGAVETVFRGVSPTWPIEGERL